MSAKHKPYQDRLRFVFDPRFDESGIEQELFSKPLPDHAELYRRTLESSKSRDTMIRMLFLRFNYARFRLSLFEKKPTKGRTSVAKRRWDDRAQESLAALFMLNRGLLSLCRRRLAVPDRFREEIMSAARVGLLQAIMHYRQRDGFAFSTLACISIRRHMQRERARCVRLFATSVTSVDDGGGDDGVTVATNERRDSERRDAAIDVRALLRENRAGLTSQERRVIRLRFGVGPVPKPPTGELMPLEVVGEMLGVSRQRAHQIEAIAMGKLRRYVRRRSHAAIRLKKPRLQREAVR